MKLFYIVVHAPRQAPAIKRGYNLPVLGMSKGCVSALSALTISGKRASATLLTALMATAAPAIFKKFLRFIMLFLGFTNFKLARLADERHI